MGIERFVTFNEVKTGAKTKKRPAPKNKTAPRPKATEKKVTETKKASESKPIIEGTKEKRMFASKLEREQTTATLSRHFEKEDRLGKDVYETVYKKCKSILGSPIKSTDKVISVLAIIPGTIINTAFISSSPRLVIERELNLVAKKYVSVNDSRRVPLLVEAKYMNSEHYPKHRKEILDQFA